MRYAMAVPIALLIALAVPSMALAAGEATGDEIGSGPITVGIVDVKRVVDECEYKTLYEKQISELLHQKQLEGMDLKQEVEKKIGDLQKEQFLRGEEARGEIQREIDAQQQRLRDFAASAKKTIEDKNREYSEELEGKVKAIVEEIAESRQINLVINSMAVLYKNGVIDLTDLVLARLNEEYRREHGEAGADPGKAGTDATGN
jgi:Skp family chaperone for outer membrane proteins